MKKMEFSAVDLYEKLPKLNNCAHKYSRGHALILAGSKDYYGAPVLACLASERAGAGYTKLITPTNCAKLCASHIISSPIIFLENNPNYFTKSDLKTVKKSLPRANALLIGPGISCKKCTLKFLEELLLNTKIECPVVLDADALNLIAQKPQILRKCKNKHVIITPHEGEAARLLKQIKKNQPPLKMPAADAQVSPYDFERINLTYKLAHYFKVTCILKGHRTIIADSHHFTIDTIGDARLAKAGTGDVLAGIVTSLLAQGLSVFDAANLAVSIHSNSALIATNDTSDLSLTPKDLIDSIPYAIKKISCP